MLCFALICSLCLPGLLTLLAWFPRFARLVVFPSLNASLTLLALVGLIALRFLLCPALLCFAQLSLRVLAYSSGLLCLLCLLCFALLALLGCHVLCCALLCFTVLCCASLCCDFAVVLSWLLRLLGFRFCFLLLLCLACFSDGGTGHVGQMGRRWA